MNISGQPKLFGGSLEEYLEVTAEEIPLIMRSCIRVINLYGKIQKKIILNLLIKNKSYKTYSLFRSSSSRHI